MRRQALLLRHRGEEPAKGAVLLRVKGRGEPEVMLAREVGKLAHQSFPGRGEKEGVQAAIVRVAAPFDIAALLELVNVYDDAAGQQSQLSAEDLLAAAGLGGDHAQDSRVRWGQFDSGDLLGE